MSKTRCNRTPRAASLRGPLPTGRPGFAMLIAVLVVTVVAFTTSVMMARHLAQARAVRRQVDAYQVQHGVRGLQDVIRAWLGSVTSPQAFAEMLDADGYALEIDPNDGSVLRVWFEPGQGLMLRDTDAAPMSVRPDAEVALAELELAFGGAASGRYLRPAGPVTVDATIAPRPVLESLALAAADGDFAAANGVTERILESRLGETFGPQQLRAAVDASRLTEDQGTRLMRMLTAEPSLWRMRAELWSIGPTGDRLIGAYAALVLLADSTSDRPSFLSWEDSLRLAGDRYVSPTVTLLEDFEGEDYTLTVPGAAGYGLGSELDGRGGGGVSGGVDGGVPLGSGGVR